ncbi:hypoxic response protein 1 [mine drainage metagenome]|uniref:Hypoxic response protein 1 n=1 Tax=mine drainage metagenome TaxID=410659 RepID=A0A1J5SN32_9ZZZZ
MSIEGMCAHGIVTADRSRTLQECAMLMGQNHVGLLLVTEEAPGGPEAVGVVTDRDFVVEALARGMPAGETAIGEIAVKRLLTVQSDASIEDAIQVMKKEGVRRLLVAAGDGHLVGVVSMDDLIDALAGEVLGIVQAIRGGITREAAAIRTSCVLCGERSVRMPKL